MNKKELKDVSMGFLHNQEITVEASPDKGYVLKSIKVKVKGATDFTDISSTKKFTASEDDYILQVNFEKEVKKCKVTVNAPKYAEQDPIVEIEGLDAEGKVAVGTEITITVKAVKFLFQFNVVAGRKEIIPMTAITAGESVSKKLTITEDTTINVSSEAPLSIMFDQKGLEAQGHKVTITGVDPNAIIKPRNGGVFTVTRTRVKIDVVPAEGYVLKKVISNRLGWSATATNEVVKQYDVDITDEINDYLTRSSRAYLDFVFEKKETLFTVTANATGNQAGLIAMELEGLTDGKIKKDGVAKLKISSSFMPLEVTVLANGKVIQKAMMVSTTALVKELTISENTNIEVAVKAGVSMTFSQPANGKVEFVGAMVVEDLINYARGQEVVLNTRANEGYKLKSIRIKGQDDAEFTDITDAKKFIAQQDEYTVEVEFEELISKKVVYITAVENGTVTLDGVESGDEVAVGTEVAINATPDKGYELESITVGGKDVTEAKKFVVGDDNTIIVKFKKATALEGLDAQIKLYPNPASEYAILSGIQAGVSVKLVSLTGKTVLIKKADYTGEVRLELTNLPRGIYIVRAADKVFKLQVQ